MGPQSVADILNGKLDTRRLVTNTALSAEELFDPAKVSDWIRKLLDSDKISGLHQRIDTASPERLTHAAAAYLLGLALRENLALNFDFLPRIFSHGAVGDSFHFFWAVICLCHDLGYYPYERGSCDHSLMDSPEGRRKLLHIRHDLFLLNTFDLAGFGISPGSEEEAWVLDSLDLAKKYDRMRREGGGPDQSGGVIDHGIAGAILLYDVLMNEYERFRPEPPEIRRRDPSKPFPIQTGELSAHAGHKRFAACAIIIACTVARHNMWVAKPEDEARYRDFGLHALCRGGNAAQIQGDAPMEQLLFLLCYMDTIDPVKGLYVRLAESATPDPSALAQRREALLNDVFIHFWDPPPFRWAASLRYRSFTITLASEAPEDVREAFSRYARELSGMEGWLITRRSVPILGKDGRIVGVTCFYPSFPKRERVWPGGIQEHEVTALCLYAGGGVGRSEFFYQCRNAYQTFNLLMMDGFEGEDVRVLQEKQQPYGEYIRKWKNTLEVLIDILNAQCKFLKCGQDTDPTAYALSRVDRKVNFEMMRRRKETFAFTSTSKAGFLREIARAKKELVLLNIVLTQRVPFLDYAGLLRQAYVYSDEQEVLLPPFLKVLHISEETLSEQDQVRFREFDKVPKKYTVKLGEFAPEDRNIDEEAVIHLLDSNKHAAAAALDKLRYGEHLSEDEKRTYLFWKEQFQLLVRTCFCNVGKTLRY